MKDNFIDQKTLLPIVDGPNNQVGFSEISISEQSDNYLSQIALAILASPDNNNPASVIMKDVAGEWLAKLTELPEPDVKEWKISHELEHLANRQSNNSAMQLFIDLAFSYDTYFKSLPLEEIADELGPIRETTEIRNQIEHSRMRIAQLDETLAMIQDLDPNGMRSSIDKTQYFTLMRIIGVAYKVLRNTNDKPTTNLLTQPDSHSVAFTLIFGGEENLNTESLTTNKRSVLDQELDRYGTDDSIRSYVYKIIKNSYKNPSQYLRQKLTPQFKRRISTQLKAEIQNQLILWRNIHDRDPNAGIDDNTYNTYLSDN